MTTSRFYTTAQFVGRLPGFGIDVRLLSTFIGELTQSVPVSDVRAEVQAGVSGVVVEWDGSPSPADLAAVDGVVAVFPGGLTSAEPIQLNSFGVQTSTSGTPVTKIDFTTPALEAGTYQVIWTTSLRMQAVIANTGVQGSITLTRSDGVAVQQDDAWDLNVRHAWNGAITFQIAEGQTIRSLLTFNRLGASGTAEMSGARVTIDKIS